MVTSDHWAGCDRIGAAGQHAVELWSDRKCAVPSYLMNASFLPEALLSLYALLQSIFYQCDAQQRQS